MKSILVILPFILFNSTTIFANPEVYVYNESYTEDIRILVYPVGAVFNGDKQYSLQCKFPLPPPSIPNYYYIYGGSKDVPKRITSTRYGFFLNHDIDDNTAQTEASVGYGKYRIDFFLIHDIDQYELVNFCYIDYSDSDFDNFPFFADIDLYYYSPHDITYWQGGINHITNQIDSLSDKTIKIWDQRLNPDQGYKEQNKNGFRSDSSGNNAWKNYPIDASSESFGWQHLNPNEFYVYLDIKNPGMSISSSQNIYFKNANFKINHGENFLVNNNSNLYFQERGKFTTVQTTGTKTITLGNNSSINVQEGGSVNLKNTIFQTSGSTWQGIKLQNSGFDSITNCTFNNAMTAISIDNDYIGNSQKKIIRKNIFNIIQDNARGIDARDLNKIIIDSNTFNFTNSNSTIGIFFRNSDSPEGAGASSFYYSLNITNNIFNNGYVPILISCLTSSRTPFYIYRNTFSGDNLYSITGLKITGDIKNNKFDINNNNRCIGLWNSNPNILGNNFNSVATNMYLNYSYPSLSPYPNSSNQLVWTGGKNNFYTEVNENIFLESSYPYLNKGKNTFTYFDSTHLFGSMPDSVTLYDIAYNCWNGNNEIPNYFLYQYLNDTTIHNVAVNYTPTFCDEDLTPVSIDIIDRGSGILDTTITTGNFTSDPITADEALLSQARTSNKNDNFTDAITNYKGVINNFTVSEYIYTSLYEMYDNYSALDTSADQIVTDVLFGDLRQYLQNKISSEIYDEDFNSQAFDVVLMCETKMKNFDDALTGYEFIALYHPNAEQRMLASWDYEDIEAMIGGSGGGEKQLGITNEELGIDRTYEMKEFQRMEKIISDDPVLRTLKKNYDKTNSIRSNKEHKNFDKGSDDKMILRAKENIFKAKFMQKEEKEKRFIEDINLLIGKGSNESRTTEIQTTRPQEFILHQNFPNPFNPTTKIRYEVPTSSQVSIKVFDITGKEIITLVNEYKQTGSYQVTFNGINLPSGIYYFRLFTNNWSQVRKMMLIK